MGFHSGGWFAFIQQDKQNDKSRVTLPLLRRVWQYAMPYRWPVVGLIVTIFISSGLSLLTPLLFRDLIDNALPNKDGGRLNWLALGMIAVPVLDGLVGVWQRQLSAFVGEGIIFDLRRGLYEHLQRMSLRFFTQTRTGELMSRLNNDVIGAQRAVTSTVVTIASNIVTLFSTLAIMVALEWRLTALSLVIFPFFLYSARRVGRILRDLRRESMVYNAEMNAVMSETLNVSGALLVKLFGREGYESGRFARFADAVRGNGVRSAVVSRWFMLALSIGSAAGTALIFWLGGRFVLADQFTAGTIVAFGSYLAQMYGPLTSLTNAPVDFVQSMVSFERVFEVLDIPIEVEERPNPVRLPALSGQVAFENVSFSYTGKEPIGLPEVERFTWGGDPSLVKRGKARQTAPDMASSTDSAEDQGPESEVEVPPIRRQALSEVTFTIEPGQLVALVGPSGAGKTTITYLLPRLYDVTNGRICVDGHDIRDLALSTLADNIGMVTQETYLFYDTIRANLLYARPDASDADLVAATQAANIYDFIMSLPERFETVVGERGYRLSGGERQRMAIARVLLKNPRLLVLDEATSSLDSLSEALIQDALAEVMRGRTSLVIAHRLSTVLSADKILVLKDGRLVEQGAHADLLAHGGLYANLYNTQFKPVPEA